MTTAILTADGHLAIPEPLRQRLKLHPGDRLTIELGPERTLVLRPEPTEEDPSGLFGMLRHLAKERPVSNEEMDQAIADEVADRLRRATRR